MKEKKKIVVIGPTYPFKGGIAHYTTLMARALENKYETEIISYSLQYPKFLYPGNEQKDFKNDSFKYDNTKFLINTINPFNWIKVASYINRQSPEAIIVQWWHPYFAPCYWALLRLINKEIKIIFLCHNVLPHERVIMDSFITKQVLKKGTAHIVQSSLDETNLLSLLPNTQFTKTVHPTYNAFKVDRYTVEESKKLLNINSSGQTLLFFGFVREYKGLKHLLKALPHVIQKLPKIKLLIVGDFFQDKEVYLDLIREYELEKYISIIDSYIPDDEVEKYFLASDLVVLPYESATQSGIVQIAYGFEKPVIVTNVGGLPEVVINEKTGYVIPPKDYAALSETIIKFFEENQAPFLEKQIKQEAYRFSWERLVEIIESHLE
ncbi:glycosyltransferase [Turicibacter sanguinis]|uniref:glycosyltransferase n=1 Tax=Turicibacter sanguinis TaxID=154288 RepID=UPI0018AAF20C|nr:glycosyltransferase [Turicibacter sanguinis]